ncbi:MAG: XrtA system polysaccharide deacetylase [Longimicrobiales bacterium]
MRHYFTVDVEEYFQASALESAAPFATWSARESRLLGALELLLALLDEFGVRGTFFVLGWVAERQPALVRRICTAGHEVASHGWDHRRVTAQTPQQFNDSVRRTKELLESITGSRVLGFRAPSFSITPGHEWALDTLIETGHAYDSSLFPIRRPGYGYAAARPEPHWIERPGGRIREFPPTTIRRFGMRLPAGGGAYFRLLPFAHTRDALKSCERRGLPGTFYIHPWELDPAQPRLDVTLPTRIRHYGGLGRTALRLRRLLHEFRFEPIADGFESPIAVAG